VNYRRLQWVVHVVRMGRKGMNPEFWYVTFWEDGGGDRTIILRSTLEKEFVKMRGGWN